MIDGGQTCRVIQQTLSDDGSRAPDAHVLIRIYQLPDASSDLVRSITRATNNQSLVDLRDLHPNDEWQRMLALGMERLGRVYRLHREEATGVVEEVTSAEVAEAVLAVWRERPDQAKFHRREHFGRLYELILRHLNAAQALIATSIYRAVERRRREAQDGSPDHLSYASHYLAMMIGRELLRGRHLTVEDVSHDNFAELQEVLNRDEDRFYVHALDGLGAALRTCYGNREVSLRQLAATFRRGDLLEMLDVAA